MADALDIKSRTHSLNEKITYAAEVQSVLRELLTESSAHRMELIIILLISVEVVIVSTPVSFRFFLLNLVYFPVG